MLNVDLVEVLYARLSKERQAELRAKLFPGSRQGISYFRKTKDITLSKLEILADYFDVSISVLRKGGKPDYNIIQGNNNTLAPIIIGASQQEVDSLQSQLLTKEETIAAKEEIIRSEKDKSDVLKEQRDDLKTQRDELKEQRNELRAERDKLKEQRDDLKEQCDAMQAELAALKSELQALKRENGAN